MIIHMALPAKIVRSDGMKLLVATNPLSQLALYETEFCIRYNSQFFVFLFVFLNLWSIQDNRPVTVKSNFVLSDKELYPLYHTTTNVLYLLIFNHY